MMFRTHLAVGVFLAVLFLPFVEHKWIFAPIVLFCSLLPDIDSMHSYLGQRWFFRPLQWVVKHRDFFHSLTLAVIVALLFAFYIPILALPFFLGYTGHLLADALTNDGIRAFWPLKERMQWRIRTGGKVEVVIFYLLIAGIVFLIGRMIYLANLK